MSERKDLPPSSANNFLSRVREEVTIMMGNRGEPLQQVVRFLDLQNSALMKIDPAFVAGGFTNRPIISGPGPAVQPVYVADLTPPPTPTGFTASAAISNLLVQHDAPLFIVGHGYLRTVLYGASRTSLTAPVPTFADAVQLTQFIGPVAAYPTNPSTIWHLWVKWMTVDGVLSESPAGGTNGFSVTTAVDVTRLVAALTGPGNPFKVVTTSYTLPDGTVVPVGTYTSDAYMGSFVAARGQIGLLAVDDARIANLNVSKLKAGSISVGEFINSSNYTPGSQGWSINGNGAAEFSGVTVRGTIYASDGTFAGTLIVGSAPEISGDTMTGNGAKIYSDGRFAIGNPSNNLVFNGSKATLNGFFGGLVSRANASAFYGGAHTSGASNTLLLGNIGITQGRLELVFSVSGAVIGSNTVAAGAIADWIASISVTNVNTGLNYGATDNARTSNPLRSNPFDYANMTVVGYFSGLPSGTYQAVLNISVGAKASDGSAVAAFNQAQVGWMGTMKDIRL